MGSNRISAEQASNLSCSLIGLHNRILNDGKFTYTYDAEGNRTSKTDNVSGSKVEYAWNHANLLTNVVYKTSNQVVTKSVSYQYDALGRRIGKAVDDNGNGTMDRRESYNDDGVGLLSSGERQGVSPPRSSVQIHISGPNGATGQHGFSDSGFAAQWPGHEDCPKIYWENSLCPSTQRIVLMLATTRM